MTGARVIVLDTLRPGGTADRRGELLDITFGWADFASVRSLVAGRCAAAGLTGARLEDFVLAVHEISANAIVHAGTGGRLTLRRVPGGLRCLITDPDPPARTAPGPGRQRPLDREPMGAVSGRGLWLAAQLADELSIASGPDGTVVSLFIHLRSAT